MTGCGFSQREDSSSEANEGQSKLESTSGLLLAVCPEASILPSLYVLFLGL